MESRGGVARPPRFETWHLPSRAYNKTPGRVGVTPTVRARRSSPATLPRLFLGLAGRPTIEGAPDRRGARAQLRRILEKLEEETASASTRSSPTTASEPSLVPRFLDRTVQAEDVDGPGGLFGRQRRPSDRKTCHCSGFARKKRGMMSDRVITAFQRGSYVGSIVRPGRATAQQPNFLPSTSATGRGATLSAPSEQVAASANLTEQGPRIQGRDPPEVAPQGGPESARQGSSPAETGADQKTLFRARGARDRGRASSRTKRDRPPPPPRRRPPRRRLPLEIAVELPRTPGRRPVGPACVGPRGSRVSRPGRPPELRGG